MLRLFAFLAATAAFVGTYVLGSTTEVGDQEAEIFFKEFEALIEGIDAAGIFVHNGLIAVGMFIPGLGVFLSLFSAWSTGYAFAAFATMPGLEGVPAIAILLTPFGAMELAAYSLATSRSALFVAMVARHKPVVPEIRILLIEGGVVAALLAAAAVIEYVAIESIDEGSALLGA